MNHDYLHARLRQIQHEPTAAVEALEILSDWFSMAGDRDTERAIQKIVTHDGSRDLLDVAKSVKETAYRIGSQNQEIEEWANWMDESKSDEFLDQHGEKIGRVLDALEEIGEALENVIE